mgnify:CR=1 FL=1
MKKIETKTVQVNSNVIKTILVDPSASLDENLNNQRKLKIRNKVQNLAEDGLDVYDLIADLSNAFFSLLDQVEHKDTIQITKFKDRFSKINEIVKNVNSNKIN